MIIKFDHITYVASRDGFVPDYREEDVLFTECRLINPIGKQKFMMESQQDSDLVFVNQRPPVEFVLYDKTFGQTSMRFHDKTIFTRAKPERIDEIESIFVKAIGMRQVCRKEPVSRAYNLKGAFDKEDILLNLKMDDSICPESCLDMEGWQCPCLLVDDIEAILERMACYSKWDYSKDFLIVNGKNLMISFLRIEGLDMMLEFISPAKQKI